MAKTAIPLSVSQIKNAKPKDKLYKLYDGLGMYLAVSPTGKKVWRFDYVDNDTGKRKTHTIGPFEFIGLSEARTIRDTLRAKIFKNESLSAKNNLTLGDGFSEWIENWGKTRSKTHYERVKRSIEVYVLPEIGHKDIGEVTTRDIASSLEIMYKREIFESLKKAKTGLKMYFSSLVSKGYIKSNPVATISDTEFVRTTKVKNFRSLKLTEIYKLNNIFRSPRLSVGVRAALEFSARNLSRPGESSGALWNEIDFNELLWSIPAERMKMDNDHIVPFSTQSLSVLNEIKKFSGGFDYIFLSDRLNGCIHRDSLNNALKRNSINSTAHGLRSTASTFLNETLLFDSDVIELCLAHKDKNKIRAVYNKALYLDERRRALQLWSDIIDECVNEDANLAVLARYNIKTTTEVKNVDIDEK